jgi:hypothetical protein
LPWTDIWLRLDKFSFDDLKCNYKADHLLFQIRNIIFAHMDHPNDTVTNHSGTTMILPTEIPRSWKTLDLSPFVIKRLKLNTRRSGSQPDLAALTNILLSTDSLTEFIIDGTHIYDKSKLVQNYPTIKFKFLNDFRGPTGTTGVIGHTGNMSIGTTGVIGHMGNMSIGTTGVIGHMGNMSIGTTGPIGHTGTFGIHPLDDFVI